MEKLYSVRSFGLVVGLLFCFTAMYAQNSLVVFKVEGSPLMKVNDSLKALSKGSQVLPEAMVSLKPNDRLLLIDREGSCFEISETRDYAYNELIGYPVLDEDSSFTKKYFTYVWSEFIRSNEAEAKTGVVFRNDKIVLLQPSDDVKIHIPEIKFVWNLDEEESFFLLKNVETDHMTKFGVTGNEITLFVDNEILTHGQSYQWAVSATKFPDLEKVEYYNFTLLSSEAFEDMKPEIDQFKRELKSLGFTYDEIRSLLCNDYKICY